MVTYIQCVRGGRLPLLGTFAVTKGTFAVTGDVCRYPGTFAVTRMLLIFIAGDVRGYTGTFAVTGYVRSYQERLPLRG